MYLKLPQNEHEKPNTWEGLYKANSMLHKELTKFYDEGEGLLGDSAMRVYKELHKLEEPRMTPLVRELY